MKVIKRISKKMCESLACPAVLLGESDNILAIGEDVSASHDCTNGEMAIKVPKDVFESRA